MKRTLSTVTLAIISSDRTEQEISKVLHMCNREIEYGDTLIITPHDWKIRTHSIPATAITSVNTYEDYVLNELPKLLQTSHVLLAQWDGYVLDAANWRDEFLTCDYIGARWTWEAHYNVGNMGFCLIGQKFFAAAEKLRQSGVTVRYPRDFDLCHTLGAGMTNLGVKFATQEIADAFSVESAAGKKAWDGKSFGFHDYRWIQLPTHLDMRK